MTEPISLSNYNPISTLEHQYAEPVGQRVLIFVAASQECCIDVESVLKFQTKRGGSMSASPAGMVPPFAAEVQATDGSAEVESANATADDPFAFLNSSEIAPSTAGGGGESSRSGGRSLKNKLLSKVKATTKHIERGMTTMAIMADKGRSRDSYQCVLQDGLGQSWSATDFQAESTDAGLVFRIPLVVWPWLDREGSVVISLYVKSGATLLKQHKPHKLGSIHLTMMDLMTSASKPNANGTAYLSQSLDSNLVQGGQMQLCLVRDNKFTPGPHIRGWSLTDPGIQGYSTLYHYPLDQSYLYKKGPGQWPIATERAVESSVVLPLAAAYAQLAERASNVSMTHAGSVLNSILENRHDSPSKCNNKASVKVSIYHMLVNDASVPVTAAVSVHWQRPDCIFEVEITGDTKMPVYTADANFFDQGKAPTLLSEFHAKVCRRNILPAISQGYARAQKPLPEVMLGNVALRVRVSTTASVSVVDNPFGPIGTGSQSVSASEDYWQATIGLETLLNNPTGKQPGPLQVPLYHIVTGKSMGSLILTMQVEGPSMSAANPGPQAIPSTGGLVSLVGLDTLTEETGAAPFLDFDAPSAENMPQDPAKVLRRQQFSTMGHFISSMYLQQHIQKVRTTDCDEADDKAVHYNKALVQSFMDCPSHQDKTPKPFRPSSTRVDKLVAGIGFNVHVQSLSLNMYNDDVQQQPLQGGWFYNITCGAPADHAKGFGDILATDNKSAKTKTSSGTSANSSNTPVGIIKGGLRRLESKRLELAKVLEEAQSALINAVGEYLKSASQRGVHQIPARHGSIAPLRWRVFELTQMLHTVTWHCAVRRSHVFSQALGVAISSYLTSVSDSERAAKGWPSLWAQHGFLVTFEGLLSAAGKELGMIEDASIGISMLRMVTVVLVSADAQKGGSQEASCNQSEKVPVAYSPHLVYVRMSCSGKGSSTQYRLEVGLDPNYYAERVPEALKNETPVRLYPVLYQVGVDIRQWGAHAGQNAKNNLKNQLNSATSSGPDAPTASEEQEKANAGGLLDDEDDDVGIPDNDELIALNYEGFRKMNAYANMIAPQTPGETLLENFPGSDASNKNAHQNVHPLLRHLYSNIMASAGKMAHGILDEAAMVAQKLGGGGVVFCKSGKDRTAMHVTYKAAQYARLFLKDPPDEVYDDATMMRVYGTRLPICEKNVGQAKYAFNSLQVKFMPDALKPPMNTLAGFLKGGAVFRGGGIES